MIEITISGEPVPMSRPRVAVRGKFATAYYPKNVQAYKELVRLQVRAQYKKAPLSQPLRVDVRIYRSIQKSGSKRLKMDKQNGVVRPTGKPDVDNYFKAVTDPMNGIVWNDDGQIVEATISKFYSDDPRAEVIVEQLEA